MKLKSILLTAVATLGLTAATLAQTVPSYVPTNGLVGWWPFNGNANDESGNGNNGIVNGTTLTSDRFGFSNSAFHFNNSGNIQAGQIQFQNYVSSGFSVSYWFTMEDSTTTNRHFLITNYDGINGLQIEYVPSSTNTLRHSLRTGAGSPPEINYYESFSVFNTWKHAVIVWSPPIMSTYINGVLTNQTTGNQISNLSVCCNVKTHFGSPWSTTNDNHKGKLDDIAIWNRALTPQEVTDLYNSSSCSNDLVVNPQNNASQTGGSVSFTATTSDPNPSYIWQSDFGQGFQTLNNFGNYSGVNTNTITINNLQLANHLQQIRAISTSGNCIDTSNVVTITLTDTCINYITVTDTLIINTTLSVLSPPNNVNTIKVYPNPASTHITIDYGDYTLMTGYTLQIVNTLGQTMYYAPINQQSSYIDLSTWTGNGLYFVQIIDPQSNVIENRKIVIQ